MADNNLTERHARALLKLDDEQAQLGILKLVCEQGLNVAQTERLIEAAIEKENAPGKAAQKNFFVGHSNVRIIVNTIKQSIKMIRDAGMDASMREITHGDYIEYTIKI